MLGLGHLTLQVGLGLAFQRASKHGHSFIHSAQCVCVSHVSKCTETISTTFFQPQRAQASVPAPGAFAPELTTSSTEGFFWLLFSLRESLSSRLDFVSNFTVWAKAAPVCMVIHALQREGTCENQKRVRSWTPFH